ncbi:MAG: phosphoglycerate kinase [Phycisphaeraceae bacterium]|nr:phosphoglycerate kinase [Phycisphaeraceae bacterium]
MPKKTIDAVDVSGKRVLIRADFNVPLDGTRITDDRRITEALPTIKSVLSRGGSCILMSHLGRPEGAGFEDEFSLAPVATRLAELLGIPVPLPSNDCVDAASAAAVAALQPGNVLLLENLRFHKAEKKNDPSFAAKLAAYGDVYVNDAFGTCHREEASMVAVPVAMQGKPRVAGLLVQKELRFLGEALAKPARPFVVVLGGAKVADKIPVIHNLLPKTDAVLIGGAMAYTFLSALGQNVGDSRVETDRIKDAQAIIDQAARLKCELHLPKDHICSSSFAAEGGQVRTFEGPIQNGFMGLDIGPGTQVEFGTRIRRAKTIVWNGPMGVFEWRAFSVGTRSIADAIVAATKSGATSIVGGGDSAAAADAFGLADQFSHVSTGGGASLEMLGGDKFASIELLDEA